MTGRQVMPLRPGPNDVIQVIWGGVGLPQLIGENAGPREQVVLQCGMDYIGLRPRLLVDVGAAVGLGQPLLEDKRDPGVCYPSPGRGTVVAINRGTRRVLESIVVRLEDSGGQDAVFEALTPRQIEHLDRDRVAERLLRSGLWTAFPGSPVAAMCPRAFRGNRRTHPSPAAAWRPVGIDGYELALSTAGRDGRSLAAFGDRDIAMANGMMKAPPDDSVPCTAVTPGHAAAWSGPRPAPGLPRQKSGRRSARADSAFSRIGRRLVTEGPAGAAGRRSREAAATPIP